MRRNMGKVKIGAFVLAAVCVLLILIRVVSALTYNRNLEAGFEDRGITSAEEDAFYIPYRQKLSMYSMGAEIGKLNAQKLSPGYVTKHRGGPFTLKHDIAFYHGPSTSEEPVMVLKSGTELSVDMSRMNLERFPCSLPTFDKGWRFVTFYNGDGITIKYEDLLGAFDVSESDMASGKVRAPNPTGMKAYVRTKDMERFWKELVESREESIEYADSEMTPEGLVYLYDNAARERGLYLSPDLYRSVWDRTDTVLAVLGIVVIACAFAYGKWHRGGVKQ